MKTDQTEIRCALVEIFILSALDISFWVLFICAFFNGTNIIASSAISIYALCNLWLSQLIEGGLCKKLLCFALCELVQLIPYVIICALR